MLAGRYRLDAALGTSNPASVWAATHLPSGRKVAIRRLPAAAGLPPQALAPLVAELHDAVVVDHPSAARVYEVVEGVADAPLVVSELLRGETLAQLLAQRPQLSVREAASLLVPVVSAVGTAHARGIVHGRLSASSVFVCSEVGAQDSVKVLDFGLAKWAAAAQAAPQSSRAGALVPAQRGSAYAPPEQAIAGRAIDHRADTWALGIILYQCLSGLDVNAFVPRQDPLTLVLEPFVPIEQRVPGLPPELADIIAHLLVSDPDHRAQNVIELFRVLSPLADRPSPSFGWPGSERRITVLTQRAVTVAPPPPAPVIVERRRPINWRSLALLAAALAAVELLVIVGLLLRERGDAPRVLQVVDATAAHAETMALRAAPARLALDDFEDGDGVPLAPVFGNWQSFTVNPAGRALELRLGEGHQSGGSAEMSFLLERLASGRVGRAGAGLRTSARDGSVDLSQFERLSFAHRHAPMSTPGLECQRTSEFVVFVTCRALGQDRVPQFEHSVAISEAWAVASVDLGALHEVGAPVSGETNPRACLAAVDSVGFRADVSPNTEAGGCDSGVLWVDDINLH